MSSWASIISTGQAGLGNHARRMVALQEQAATGARINRASDDPSTAYRILTLRAQAGMLGTYAENLADVAGMLEQNHNVVSEVSSSLQTVLAKVEQAASGTYGQSARNVVAGEIDGILEQMLFVVNTDAFGRYLFSGAKTDTAPYASESDGEYITAVRYMGSSESLPVPVAPGVTVSSVAVGERAFRSDDRQDPNMLGQTGATAGSGTATIRGDVYVQIAHDQTTITNDPDGSGLAVSGAAAFVDTALGEYDLVVDVPGQTIAFVGGPAVAFAGTETALAVANADGDVVHVDVTGLNGALVAPATVSIKSTATVSIDGGGAPVALSDFTETNLALADAEGRLLYVDVRGVRRTGLEPVRVPGTFDLFGTLIQARDVLRNARGLTGEEQHLLLQKSYESIREIIGTVTRTMTSTGARLEALDVTGRSLDNIQFSAEAQAAAMEEADLVEVAAELARAQMLYEMALASTSRALSLSLLDYL